MELHLNARLMMNELIKINFIIMNTKGSNDDWLLVLENGLINIHTSGAFLDSSRARWASFCDRRLDVSCGRGLGGSSSFRN